MKTRVNGSHLKRNHNITLKEYKQRFPLAVIGKRTQNIITYKCRICNKISKGSSSLSRHLRRFHNFSLEDYYIKYYLEGNPPKCKCGCGITPSFLDIDHGYHDYVIHHNPVWNTGLNKENDARVFIMYDNRKTWNKGLTKQNNPIIANNAQKIKKFWTPENIKQRTQSYEQTMLKKYGVRNCFQRNETKEKIKTTLISKYGVENPQFSNEIRYKWKKFILPSGKQIKCQGYEPFAMRYLLSLYNEEDIITIRNNIPKILYTDFDGSQRKYCPDMWIPKENLLVEVKSNFTYQKHQQNIKSKKSGVIQSGFKFKLLVFNDNGSLNQTINE